jgi:hypothetical protein
LKKVFSDKVPKGPESLRAPDGILKAPAGSPIGKHQNSLPLFIKPHIAMWQVYTVSYIVMWPHLLVNILRRPYGLGVGHRILARRETYCLW